MRGQLASVIAVTWCVLAAMQCDVTVAVPASLLQGAADNDAATDKAPAVHEAHPPPPPAAVGMVPEMHASEGGPVVQAPVAASTAAPEKTGASLGTEAAAANQLQRGFKHGHAGISKRNENAVLKSELYSEPPGGEFRIFRDDDRRRRSAASRLMRGPVKRSILGPLNARNKRDLQLDADDALALLALWASTANVTPRNYAPYGQDSFLPRFLTEERTDHSRGTEFETPEDNEIDDADVVLPGGGDDDPFSRYGSWGATADDYNTVPDRFNVMRRSPALYPILNPYKREPGYAEVAAPSMGRWGAFAPQPRKRFMVSKRQSGNDVYSLAQLLSDHEQPAYRRLML